MIYGPLMTTLTVTSAVCLLCTLLHTIVHISAAVPTVCRLKTLFFTLPCITSGVYLASISASWLSWLLTLQTCLLLLYSCVGYQS